MNASYFDEGLGRLNFFLGKISIGVVMAVAVTWLGPGSSVLWWVGLALSFVSFALDVMRLRSIGVSQWFAVLRFVPYVNLVYMILLQSAQTGWIESRSLDQVGKTLLVFQLALLGLLLLMLARMGVDLPYFLY